MMMLMFMRGDVDYDDGDADVICFMPTLEGHTSCRGAVRERRLRLAFEDQFVHPVPWRNSFALLRSPREGLHHRESEVPLLC